MWIGNLAGRCWLWEQRRSIDDETCAGKATTILSQFLRMLEPCWEYPEIGRGVWSYKAINITIQHVSFC